MTEILIIAAIAVGSLLALSLALILSPAIRAFQTGVLPEAVLEHIDEGKDAPGKRVLIAYYSRKGTTASIAQKIYEVLTAQGCKVDMRFIPNIAPGEDLQQYDFFVLGSAVIWKMVSDFSEFVVRHRELLAKKPVAVFATCLTIQRETPKNRERVEAYLQSGIGAVPELNLVAKTAFGGKVEFKNHNLCEKAFLKFLFTVTPLRGGDHRDWDKITAWAEKIATEISPPVVPAKGKTA